MKRIILDYLERYRWLWIAILVMQFLWGGISRNSRINATPTCDMLMWCYLLGGWQLMSDFQRGLRRVLLALPITATQIGHALWLLTVGIPSTLLFTVWVLGRGLFHYTMHSQFHFGFLVSRFVCAFLWSGVFFSQLARPPRLHGKIMEAAYAAILVGLYFSVSDYCPLSPTAKVGAFWVVGSIMTTVGLIYSDWIVSERKANRTSIQVGTRQPGQEVLSKGFGGVSLLVMDNLAQLACIVVTLIIVLIFAAQQDGVSSKDLVLPLTWMGGAPFLAICGLQLAPMIGNLRSLRAMPISVTALAFLLSALTVAPIVVIGIIFTGIEVSLQRPADVALILQSVALLAPMAALCVPIYVRGGSASGAQFVIFIIMTRIILWIMSEFIPLFTDVPLLFFLDDFHVPIWASLMLSALCIGVCFVITLTCLRWSSLAYRPPASTFQDVNARG